MFDMMMSGGRRMETTHALPGPVVGPEMEPVSEAELTKREFAARTELATRNSHKGVTGKIYAPPATVTLDTHVHFYDPTRDGGVPWPPATNAMLYRKVQPSDLERITREWGITGCIVVQASPLMEDNAALMELATENPFVRGVVGGGFVPGSPEFREDLKRFESDPLFVGIRIRASLFESLLDDSALSDLLHLEASSLTVDILGPFSPKVRFPLTLDCLSTVFRSHFRLIRAYVMHRGLRPLPRSHDERQG